MSSLQRQKLIRMNKKIAQYSLFCILHLNFKKTIVKNKGNGVKNDIHQ